MKRKRRTPKANQPSNNGDNNGRCSRTGQFIKNNTYGQGRPKYSRNKLGAMLLDEHEQLTRKVIDMALHESNIPALKLCLERLIPVVRDTHVNVILPKVDNVASASLLTGTLLDLVSTGAITPSQGEQLSRLTERHLKSLQLSDLEARLEQLEQSLIQGQGG